MKPEDLQRKVFYFRIVVVVAFVFLFGVVVCGALGFDLIKPEYATACFWGTLLATFVAGYLIFGKEFGNSRRLLKNLKEIRVINHVWLCPHCGANNPDRFLATPDATMNCEECGQIVVREPGSFDIGQADQALLERTRSHQKHVKAWLAALWVMIAILYLLQFIYLRK